MSEKDCANSVNVVGIGESDEQHETDGIDDLQSWCDFFNAHRSELLGYAGKITGNSEEARDILQDAFCRLARLCPKFDKVGTLQRKPYLFVVIRNLCTDALRKTNKHKLVRMDDPDFLSDQVRELAAFCDTHRILETANMLDFLGEELEPPDDRVYQLMREDKTRAEIAQICGISVADVRRSEARIKYHTRSKLKQPNRGLPDIKRTGKPAQKSPVTVKQPVRNLMK
jgi:RNA polymerase sigma factor (sigma-70 family)